MQDKASVAMLLLLSAIAIQMHYGAEASNCRYTVNQGERYRISIALLATSHSDFRRQKVFQENILLTGELADCFWPVQWIYLYVNETLHLEKDGWKEIERGIHQAVTSAAVIGGHPPVVVIGPFYTNLAMILGRLDIVYVTTQHKGFSWIDETRVTDHTPWETLVEIPPPPLQQNLAVVDLFKSKEWPSAILMMPVNAADNQECQDLMGQLLNSSVSLIPFTLDPTSSSLMGDIKDILRSAHLVSQNIMLVCSPRDPRDMLIEKILTQARKLGVLDDKEVTFLFVDPTSSLVPFGGAGEMHALGLLSARCQILAFRYSQPQHDDASQEGKAVASDAGRVVTLGLHKYLLSQPSPSDDFNRLEFIKAIKRVKLRGLTGWISFDDKGQRSNFTLELYNHGGNDLYKKIAEWTPNGATTRDRLNITGGENEDDGNRKYGIFPDVVKIVVVREYPFVMKRQFLNGLSHNTPITKSHLLYEGFTIDLIATLAQELNFQYQIYESPGNSYGGINPDGTWDGMVGEIINGNATLACGAISITSARESFIDFSLGVLSTGVNILIHKPDESYNIFQFMKPFSLQLWVAILGALTLVSSVYFVLDYWNGPERKFTFKETVWFTIGTMLKRGSDFVPTPVSQRILTIGLSFFVIITVSSYTANMAAFLTTKKFAETVDSFESLAKSSKMQVTTVKHSATSSYFQKGTKMEYRMLWSKMRRSGLVNEASEGLSRVVNDKHTAFVFDYLINDGAQNRNCSTMAIGQPILLQEHGIGMMPGAPFKTRINIAILKLKEQGYLARLRKKWWDDKRECQLGGGHQTADQAQFGVKHTLGVFIVSLFGVCVSAILFLSKKISFAISTRYKRYRAQRQHRHANNSTIIGDEPGTPI